MKQFVSSLMKELRSTLHGNRSLVSAGDCVFIVLNRGFFFGTYLRDLVGDVVRTIFDLWSDDGFLGGRRGGALLLVVGLGEVERDEGDLVDGAVLVEVGVGGGAEQAGFDLAERPWKKGRHTVRAPSLKVLIRPLLI